MTARPYLGESVEEQEDIAGAGDSVTNPRTFPEQSSLPAQVPGQPQSCEVFLLPPGEPGPGQEVDGARGSVAPVDQLRLGPPLPGSCRQRISVVHCSVEIISEEFIVMLRQLSYAKKNQQKAPSRELWVP